MSIAIAIGVEVAAVVADDDRRAPLRDVLDAVDVEARVRHQLGPRERHRELLRLDAEELGDAGGHVEVQRTATGAAEANELQPRVGVDRDRMPDGRQQRGVVDAVGVGLALRQVDAVLVGPRAHRGELAVRPHELADDRAVVGAVVGHAVAGGDDVVETEQSASGFTRS